MTKKTTLREAAILYKHSVSGEIADRAAQEALDVITDGKEEIREVKKINFDKTIAQFSVKIPKGLALKAGLNESSDIEIVVNPREETIKNIKSGIIIFKRGDKNGETKEGT